MGIAAVAGGALLAASPDGRLLAADPGVLSSTPFADWYVPGILLALLVGGGALLALVLTLRDTSYSRAYGAVYATGLLVFEGVEYTYIGWQPLQAVVGALGIAMLLLTLSRETPRGFGGRATRTV